LVISGLGHTTEAAPTRGNKDRLQGRKTSGRPAIFVLYLRDTLFARRTIEENFVRKRVELSKLHGNHGKGVDGEKKEPISPSQVASK